MIMSTSDTTVRELDRRINDGFDVRLLWHSATNRVFVTVEHRPDGDSFTLEVDPTDALEAFHHPFAYFGNYDTELPPLGRLPVVRLGGEEQQP
jgi:hypothetical protein